MPPAEVRPRGIFSATRSGCAEALRARWRAMLALAAGLDTTGDAFATTNSGKADQSRFGKAGACRHYNKRGTPASGGPTRGDQLQKLRCAVETQFHGEVAVAPETQDGWSAGDL